MAFQTVTGYCWPQSVVPGDGVGLHLSSPGGRDVHVRIARIGATEDVVFDDTVPAAFRETPDGADAGGCDWPVADTVAVGDDWRSGYYDVTLTIDLDGKTRRTHAFFVVRPTASSTNTILLPLATNTWHAYNDFGGRNLYTGGTHVALTRPMTPGFLAKPPGPGRRVTNQTADDVRMTAHVGYLQLHKLAPYAGSAGWPDWEQPFLAWAERHGYGIDVCTNPDLADHPEVLEGKSLVLSVGHDEYWSMGMRDAVESFTAAGGNAAFLSGNTAFWQVRLEQPTPEGPAGVMVGYKGMFKDDPVWDTDRVAELTSMWSDHVIERPENHMTGVSFSRGGYHRIGPRATNGAGGYTMYRTDHWLFEGTGLDYGDVLGAESCVVGYECDGCAFTMTNGLPTPTGEDGTPTDFEIFGIAPTAHFTRAKAPRPPAPGTPSELEFISGRVLGRRVTEEESPLARGHATFGAFETPGGGTVVTSGSTDWAHGLDGRSPRIERITANLLDRLG